MGEGRIRLIRAVPGPTGLGPLVARFCRDGEGFLTAFDDAALHALAALRTDEDCEVVSFPALVQRVLAASGEPHGRLASSGHQQAAIARALANLPSDSILGRGANHPGLHRALLRTLHELHAFGLAPDEMETVAANLPHPLDQKLAEIASVDRTLVATLASLGLETHGRHLKACEDALVDGDGEECRALVIVGGERGPERLRWLRWAASAGWDLTIVVERHATDGKLFAAAREAEEILGVPAQDIGDGHRLLNNLFAIERHEGPAIDLEIRSTADPLAECEWALRGCLEIGPDRCGLYVRDLESYAPLLQAASVRLGVPVCVSQRVPLLTNAFARLTLDVLEFAAGNDVRTLRSLLRSSYLGLDGRERRSLESALRESHRMGPTQWESLGDWVRQNADRFDWLTKVLAWRDAARSSAGDLGDWLDRLKALVHELPWHKSMGDSTYNVGRDTRAFSAMQTAIANEASIERALEPKVLDLAGFAARCRALWENQDVSLPTPDIGVPVATHAAALTGVHTLFVLGMLEGSFPRRASQDPILGDDERRAISIARPDQPPLPLSSDRAAAERDEFYRVCAAATHRLVLSYPQADDARDNVPAFYLEAAAAAAGQALRRDIPRTLLAPETDECLAAADLTMRAALDAPRVRPDPVLLEDESARVFVTSPAGARTPAELRDAVRCPFLYAARHRLGLQPRRRSERWSRLRSLPQSARLPETPDEIAARTALEAALETELDLIASDVPEWEIPLLRAGGRRLIEDWLRREFVARKVWPIDEGSLKMNVPFGEEGTRSAMPLGVNLAGAAPAISRRGNTRTLHLYGTSVPRVKELTEADRLFLGLHLLTIYEPASGVALEIESTSGKRSLLRLGGSHLGQRPNEGLETESLSDEDDRDLGRRLFFEGIKESLRRAIRVVEHGDMRPQPGQACETCDYGELCRRSTRFGEEDSPFGADLRGLGGAGA